MGGIYKYTFLRKRACWPPRKRFHRGKRLDGLFGVWGKRLENRRRAVVLVVACRCVSVCECVCVSIIYRCPESVTRMYRFLPHPFHVPVWVSGLKPSVAFSFIFLRASTGAPPVPSLLCRYARAFWGFSGGSGTSRPTSLVFGNGLHVLARLTLKYYLQGTHRAKHWCSN